MRFSLRTLLIVMLLGGPLCAIGWRWATRKPVFPPQPVKPKSSFDLQYFIDQADELSRQHRQQQWAAQESEKEEMMRPVDSSDPQPASAAPEPQD